MFQLTVILMTADVQLRQKTTKGFCDNPYPLPKSYSLARKLSRELLKIVIRMLKCSSPQLMASGGNAGREGLSFR